MKFFYAALVMLFCGCQSLKVATNKTPKNTPSIGIAWDHGGRINEALQPRLDSVIGKIMADFNAENHLFTVHKKLPKDKDYLTVDFVRGKVASKGERVAGYVVSTVGLIVAPVYLATADLGFVAAFYYWPVNRIQHYMQLSPNLAETGKRKIGVIETGALFAKSSRQVDKLLTKFGQQLHLELVKIEAQLEKN